MRTEIESVVQGIRERYAEPLSLNDLGEIARLSPYHMARVFRESTGLPPARFLTAVRLEEAKRKLLYTSESVADISTKVGYTSLGTFTTRFTKTFGLSPGQYRKLSNLGPDVSNFAGGNDDAPHAYGTITGRVHRTDGRDDAPVFAAAFHESLSMKRPMRCRRAQRSSDPWTIAHVPAGRWFIEAVSDAPRTGPSSVAMGSVGPVLVTPGAVVHVDVTLQPSHRARPADGDRCPFAIALTNLYAA